MTHAVCFCFYLYTIAYEKTTTCVSMCFMNLTKSEIIKEIFLYCSPAQHLCGNIQIPFGRPYLRLSIKLYVYFYTFNSFRNFMTCLSKVCLSAMSLSSSKIIADQLNLKGLCPLLVRLSCLVSAPASTFLVTFPNFNEII